MYKTEFTKNNETYTTKNGFRFNAKIADTNKIENNIIETYLPINVLNSNLELCDLVTPFLLRKNGFVKNKNGTYIRKHLAVGVEINTASGGYGLINIVYCGLIDYLDGSMQRFPKIIKTIYELNNIYRTIEHEDFFNYS